MTTGRFYAMISVVPAFGRRMHHYEKWFTTESTIAEVKAREKFTHRTVACMICLLYGAYLLTGMPQAILLISGLPIYIRF